jgi:hypothetical protein
MRIRLHYHDGSTAEYNVFGFATDESSKHLDLIVKAQNGRQSEVTINWPAVVRVENLEALPCPS